jgi:hypothetical protein
VMSEISETDDGSRYCMRNSLTVCIYIFISRIRPNVTAQPCCAILVKCSGDDYLSYLII